MGIDFNDTAVIFDLDGVISDTQDLHALVDSKVLSEFGINVPTDDLTLRFAGTGDERMFTTLFQEHKIEGSIFQAIDAKWAMMANALKQDRLRPMPHSIELIQMLKAEGLKLAVGSGSPIIFIETVLDTLSLHPFFECYVSAHEVTNPKPYPDIFLECSRRIGASPNKCIVIEDGIVGMQAAANAGMACIGLVKDSSKNYPATTAVTSLADVSFDLINQMRKISETLFSQQLP
jgi:HAD superfamily hydrolase (TIGR01509 family)